ncbi:MAG: PilZ domain-containing protein [Candidatus Omnitrophica bacterium]|nr:PilZ domain-containing protein [Candidatus Omnitrophota bacterium]
MPNAYEHVFLTAATDVFYKITQDNSKHESNALVTEVSSSGLKFVNTELILPNTILDLKIILDHHTAPLLAQARVLWQRQANSILLNVHTGKGYLHNTAVVFTDFSEQDKINLNSYIQKFSQTIACNRAHLRWPLVLDAEFYLLNKDKNRKYDCVIGDIGIEGVKLFSNIDIPLNSIIKLIFSLPDAFGSFNIRGTIVRKVETKHNIWALGIEFSGIKIQEKEIIIDFISSRLGK